MAVVQGGYGSCAGQLGAVLQGKYRQEGRLWYKAYPGKQVPDRQASSGSACMGFVEGPEVQQLVCNCLSYCRICRHTKSTCQTCQTDEFVATADRNSLMSMLCRPCRRRTLLAMGSVDASESTALLYVCDFLLRQVTTCRMHDSFNSQFHPQHRSQTNRDQIIASKGK